MHDLDQSPGDRRRVSMTPDVAPERNARHARAQGVAHLSDQAIFVRRAVTAQDHHRYGCAVDHAVHALRIAGIEGFDIVSAHFGGLATNAGNVLRCVFFGLVKTAWDDLGLEWNSPALADQGVALEGGPLGAIAATGE